MRILHITNFFDIRLSYQENCLICEQSKRGHCVALIASVYGVPKSKDNIIFNKVFDCGNFNLGDVEIIRKRSFVFFGRPSFIIFNVISDILRYRPDVIHVHNSTNIWFLEVLFLRMFRRFKIFVDCHMDELVNNNSSSFLSRLYYIFWAFIHSISMKFNFIDHYLPITTSSKIWLFDMLKIPFKKQTISYLGVGTSGTLCNFDDISKPSDFFVVVYSGKIYKEKKVDYVVKLVNLLHNSNIPVKLKIIGDPVEHYRTEFNSIVSSLPQGTLIQRGFLTREELLNEYRGSHLALWPGVPSISIQEAMSCGVVLGLPKNNIVSHLVPKNGFFLSFDLVEDSNFIRSIIADFHVYSYYSYSSFKLSKQYSWGAVCDALIDIYDE